MYSFRMINGTIIDKMDPSNRRKDGLLQYWTSTLQLLIGAIPEVANCMDIEGAAYEPDFSIDKYGLLNSSDNLKVSLN